MATNEFKRVYVWQLPIRLFHWLNVICIIGLIATGIIIGNPPAILSNVEANDGYWFGIIRFSHFTMAYILVFTLLVRIYYLFVGNRYANWRAFWPFTTRNKRSFGHAVKHDIMLIPEKHTDFHNISVGHNGLAAVAYLGLFVLMLIMIFTGFSLYADLSGWWFADLFAWVGPMLGGDFALRLIHHITMYLIIIFIIIHVYLVFYHDWLEGRGEVSSMFSGYKFVRKERLRQE